MAKNGREIDENGSPVWTSGLKIVDCFTKVTHLVTQQYIVFDTPVQGCKTADDVNVIINSSVVFRIMGDSNKGEDPAMVPKVACARVPLCLEADTSAALLTSGSCPILWHRYL